MKFVEFLLKREYNMNAEFLKELFLNKWTYLYGILIVFVWEVFYHEPHIAVVQTLLVLLVGGLFIRLNIQEKLRLKNALSIDEVEKEVDLSNVDTSILKCYSIEQYCIDMGIYLKLYEKMKTKNDVLELEKLGERIIEGYDSLSHSSTFNGGRIHQAGHIFSSIVGQMMYYIKDSGFVSLKQVKQNVKLSAVELPDGDIIGITVDVTPSVHNEARILRNSVKNKYKGQKLVNKLISTQRYNKRLGRI